MSGVVDFLPLIDRDGWFTPSRDGDIFAATIVVLANGAGLTWPEEIDYSADFLRRVAFPDGVPVESAEAAPPSPERQHGVTGAEPDARS